MKILKHLIFTAVFLIGLSTAAMAQKDGPKRPPKNPPTINAPDKGGNKPKENPKGNNDRGGKKPGMAFYFRVDDNTIEVM